MSTPLIDQADSVAGKTRKQPVAMDCGLGLALLVSGLALTDCNHPAKKPAGPDVRV